MRLNKNMKRARKVLESRSIADDDRIDQLEKTVKDAKYVAEEADRKYDECARKLLVTEASLERAEDQLGDCQRKIRELEDEQLSLGQQARSFESDFYKASQREDSYEETIRDLTQRLKDRERRMEDAERENVRLRGEVEHLEKRYDDLTGEYTAIKQEMEKTFADLDNI